MLPECDRLARMSMGSESPSVDAGLCRAWYGAPIGEFLKSQPAVVGGELATNSNFTLVSEQKDAWLTQIEFLQANLSGIAGCVFLEFNIPRMGRRIDALLVSSGIGAGADRRNVPADLSSVIRQRTRPRHRNAA
jgi:hypothetical protein